MHSLCTYLELHYLYKLDIKIVWLILKTNSFLVYGIHLGFGLDG